MYMRFVHVTVKPAAMADLSRLYEEKVIPTLHAVPGCLYASLIQGALHADECISMTLWETPQQATAYERGGVFASLLAEAGKYLADTSEWKIHLSSDLELKYEPVPEEPVIDAYNVPPLKPEGILERRASSGFYLRIVSPQIRKGKIEEFKRIYATEVSPALRMVPGCRYAAVIEHAQDPEKIISISIWDSKADADHYEIDGTFAALSEKFKHTFSEVYQWKMQLEKETGKHTVTSDEIGVEGYTVVTGKSFL
jgi:heme-degrading monooxygenase HmoA